MPFLIYRFGRFVRDRRFQREAQPLIDRLSAILETMEGPHEPHASSTNSSALRYKLLWAKTRSRNGRIALFLAGYLLLVALIALLTSGGVGAAIFAIRSGKRREDRPGRAHRASSSKPCSPATFSASA